MEHYFNKIQDYIDGLLSEEERKEFEKQLTIDTALREETLLRQELNNTIQKHLQSEQRLGEMTETLEQLKQAHFYKKNIVSLNKRKWLYTISAAAGMMLILFLSGIFNSTQFDRLPELTTSVTRSNAAAGAQQEAIDAFNRQEYNTSAAIWEKQRTEEKDSNATTIYYLGLSYIGQKQYNMAIPLLEQIAGGPSVYKEEAAYFAGFAYYKTDHSSQSAYWLKQVGPKSPYHKKARKLLNKMKAA